MIKSWTKICKKEVIVQIKIKKIEQKSKKVFFLLVEQRIISIFVQQKILKVKHDNIFSGTGGGVDRDQSSYVEDLGEALRLLKTASYPHEHQVLHRRTVEEAFEFWHPCKKRLPGIEVGKNGQR
jgi:hypothetical protein